MNESIIKNLDNIIHNFKISNKINENDIIKNIIINNFNKDKKYFFGITVHLCDNIELIKIFLKILNEKINFENIVFCFIDDGINISSVKLFESLKLKFDYILIKCFKNNNIFNLKNNHEVGSFYPITLYIGNEILKNNCKYLGILHSCTWISKDYFSVAKSIISDMSNNSILSLFVDSKYKNISTTNINNIEIFHSMKLNKISLFYDINLYENIKKFFTGLNKKYENIQSYNPLKWNNQICNYIKENNGNIIITHESYIQHLDLYNKKYNNIDNKVFDLLIKPENYKHLQINYNFKVNNIELLKNILKLRNIDYIIKDNISSEKYKSLDFLLYNDLIHLKINTDYINCNYNNYIISMAVLPNRLLHNEFENVIISLIKQKIKPNKIIINYCKNYKRNMNYNKIKFNKKIEYFNKKYPNLYFNESIDYGPATKLIGLTNDNVRKFFKDDTKVIILDDDFRYNPNLIYFYELTYQLYNCDYVAIDEKKIIKWKKKPEFKKNKDIIFDNYQGFIYGWLTFSIKYKFINNIKDFYDEIYKINKHIFYHDDLLFTLYLKKYNYYGCGINLFLTVFGERQLELVDGLRIMNNDEEWMNRAKLEIQLLDYYNIEIKKKNLPKCPKCLYIVEEIKQNNYYNYNFNIFNNNKNYLLKNIKNIHYDLDENNYKDIQWDIKYFCNNIIILTFTKYNNLYNIKNFIFYINNKKYKIIFKNINENINKQTFFIYIDEKLKTYNFSNNKDIKIIQTYECNNISKNRFYSICSLRNYLPEYDYIFFSENDRIDFIKKNYSNFLETYQKVNVGAYKADLFRIMYLYKFGGLYFDCKNILYCPLDNLLNNNEEIFLKDVYPTKYANGIILLKNKENKNFKNYMIDILYNFHNSIYTNSCLSISGPKLLSKHIEHINSNYLKNNVIDNDWKNAFVTYNKKKIIKISYSDYYDENNYVNKKHYAIMYNENKVYNKIPINYSKINGISGIAWINMNRSIDRKKYVENIMKNINIHNFRIEAIDGKLFDRNKLINIKYARNMTDGEVGCTLSHIKAIQYLHSLDGEYFLVCEDDISFRNINLFCSLSNIINKNKNFDILLLSKIYPTELNDEYTDWNNYLEKFDQIAGTGCYLISRNGINKILNICTYDSSSNNFKFIKETIFDVADMFIFKNTNSFVYKYNYVSLNTNFNSNIHENQNEIHELWHDKCEKNQDKIIIKNLLG